MKPKIYFLIYISTATVPFSKKDLLELLAKARQNNPARDITGMLLYKNGSFQQILEGPKERVRSLFAKIKSDPRHMGVIEVLSGEEDERQFPDWSMGFYDLNSAEAAAIPGYTPFLNTPLTDPQFLSNPGILHRMILTFKKNTVSKS